MIYTHADCKIGCDDGIVYTRRFGISYPIQCVYCLELTVQERFPDRFPALGDVQQYTRGELTAMLEDGNGKIA